MAPRYGFFMEWSPRVGTCMRVDVDACNSWEEAREAAVRSARWMGWTSPRWWQWWRWGEVSPYQWPMEPAPVDVPSEVKR